MQNKYFKNIIDILGKSLLLWYLLCTFIYFHSGSFVQGLKGLPDLWDFSVWWFLYFAFQIPICSLGILCVAFFLLKRHPLGIIFGVLYWFMGYFINPLWYLIPKNLQISSNGTATVLLKTMNIAVSVLFLVIIILFYFNRKKTVVC